VIPAQYPAWAIFEEGLAMLVDKYVKTVHILLRQL